MKYRQLADTGLRVSEVGFGAWGIGGATPGATSYGPTDDRESRGALQAAVDCGINFFDTANVYGAGHSESLIGTTFARSRSRVIIATKAGLARFDAPADYSPGAIRASLEGSLRRLQTDYVDLLQLHNASPAHLDAHPEILAELRALREKGLIRAYGVSAKSPQEALDCVRHLGIRIVQVNLNMLDMRARECGLLDAAAACGASLIARTPLCFGFLADRPNRTSVFAAEDHRSRWARSQIEKWLRGADALFAALGHGDEVGRSQLALRFCLSFAPVATVIPGMLTAQEVTQNSLAANLGPLPDEDLAALAATYRELDLSVAS